MGHLLADLVDQLTLSRLAAEDDLRPLLGHEPIGDLRESAPIPPFDMAARARTDHHQPLRGVDPPPRPPPPPPRPPPRPPPPRPPPAQTQRPPRGVVSGPGAGARVPALGSR